jgi:hypothetical protein
MYHHVVGQPYFGLKPLVADLAGKSVGFRVIRLHVMPEQHKQQLLQKARILVKLAYRSKNFFQKQEAR